MRAEPSKVQRGAIAFMPGKFIARVLRVPTDHEAVARNFGEHAGRGDAEAEPVAADERGQGMGKGADGPTVDEHMLRRDGKGGDGAAHRFVGGLENVDPVDLGAFHYGERPENRGVSGELVVESLARADGEFFRVVELRVVKLRR